MLAGVILSSCATGSLKRGSSIVVDRRAWTILVRSAVCAFAAWVEWLLCPLAMCAARPWFADQISGMSMPNCFMVSCWSIRVSICFQESMTQPRVLASLNHSEWFSPERWQFTHVTTGHSDAHKSQEHTDESTKSRKAISLLCRSSNAAMMNLSCLDAYLRPGPGCDM